MEKRITGERLNRDEFTKLIPHLELDDIFLIQIYKYRKWMPMVERVFLDNQEQICCNVCDGRPLIRIRDILVHVKNGKHKSAEKYVIKFYHPVYTVTRDKVDDDSRYNLEKNVAQYDRAKPLATHVQSSRKQTTVYLALDDILNIVCNTGAGTFPLISDGQSTFMRCVLCNKNIFTDLNSHLRDPIHIDKMLSVREISLKNKPDVNKFALIQSSPELEDEEFDGILKEILLKDKPTEPHLMHLIFEMPYEELFHIEYLVGRSWIPMLVEIPNENYIIKCKLCGKICTIANVPGHLMGKQHKTLQLQQQAIRHKTIKAITKYASFAVGNKHKMLASVIAKKIFKTEVEKELRKRSGKDHSNVTKRREAGTLNSLQAEADEIDRLKGAVKYDESYKDSKTMEKPKTSDRKSTLNIDKEDGLIGVEYVVRIISSANNQTTRYECCLCEVFTDEYSMQDHLTSYTHRYKYCEIHYSSALQKYLSLCSDKHCDSVRVMERVLARMAFGIEEYHGRGIPRVVSENDFVNSRPAVIAELYSSRHASQLYGPAFTNIFSEEEINKMIFDSDSFKAKGKRLKAPSKRFAKDTGKQLYCSSKVWESKIEIKPTAEPSRKDLPKQIRQRSKSRSPNLPNKILPPRKLQENYSNKISHNEGEHQKQNIWQRYHQQILISTNEIERAYAEYRKNPESHPLYDEEWNRFWKMRKDELISLGIKHTSYDFQPEWVNYFQTRIDELMDERLKQAEFDVRMRLNIPLNAVEDVELRNKRSGNLAPNAVLPNDSLIKNSKAPDVKAVPQNSGHFKRVSSENLPVQKKRRVNTDNLVMQWNSQKKYMGTRDDDDDNGDHAELEKLQNDNTPEQQKPDVKHVLRLLAAFEDYLGSLGPKLTEMLYTTLSLDKSLPKNPLLLEQKVLTADNCSLLETATEKLRGILYAGLLEPSKKPGFNQVIKSTTDLLKYAERKGFRHLPVQCGTDTDNMYTQRAKEMNFSRPLNWIDSEKNDTINSNLRTQKNISRDRAFERHEENMTERKKYTVSEKKQFHERPSQNTGSSKYPQAGVGQNRYFETKNKTDNIYNAAQQANNSNNSNQSNSYKKMKSLNVNSRAADYEGFSDNWKLKPNNLNSLINPNRKDKANINNMYGGGRISDIQRQNLHQLYLLRQQQEQRGGWQN